MTNTTLTALEIALLSNIVDSEYQNGGNPVEYDVWSTGDFLTGGLITAKNIAGVMSSLVKKGFVRACGRGADATACITQTGYDALLAAK